MLSIGTLGAFFNAMKKTEKSLFVQNLTEEIKASSAVVLVDYAGLSVKMQQDLKEKLREVNARMVVAKNTLLRLAATDAKVSSEIYDDSAISGPTALIMTEGDPIAPLQVVSKFAKEFSIPSLKVGIVEGSFQDTENLTKLSKLPSKDVLYAQAVGAIGGPLYGLVYSLQANMTKLVYVLNEASKK